MPGGWQHFPLEISFKLSLAPVNPKPLRYKNCSPAGHSVYPAFPILSPKLEDKEHVLSWDAVLGSQSREKASKLIAFMVGKVAYNNKKRTTLLSQFNL